MTKRRARRAIWLAMIVLAGACNPYREALPAARCRRNADCTAHDTCWQGRCTESQGVVEGSIVFWDPSRTPTGALTIAVVRAGDWSGHAGLRAGAITLRPVQNVPAPIFPFAYRFEKLPLRERLVVVAVLDGSARRLHAGTSPSLRLCPRDWIAEKTIRLRPAEGESSAAARFRADLVVAHTGRGRCDGGTEP